MPDISMCTNGGCPLRHTCYRFRAVPKPRQQSYGAFLAHSEANPCSGFAEIWPNDRVGTPLQADLRLLNTLLDDVLDREKVLKQRLSDVQGEKSLIYRAKHALISGHSGHMNTNTRDQPVIMTIRAKIDAYLRGTRGNWSHYGAISTAIGEKKASVKACLHKNQGQFKGNALKLGWWMHASRLAKPDSHAIG